MSNYNIPMNLAGSARRNQRGRSSAGYAMAALLVALSVMAILMSVALPTWTQTIRREKEEELVFRGNQYARAINQYQRKFANQSPASLDVLIEQHFLRKKFTDPLSPNEDGEFQMLYVSAQGAGGQSGAGSVVSMNPSGGIMGVVSKNPGQSIRILDGKNHYNEWQFMGIQQTQQAGAAQQGQGQGRGTGTPQQGTGTTGTQQQQQSGRGTQPTQGR